MSLVISMGKTENPLMSSDILAIAIATMVQLLGLVFLGRYLSRMLREISAEVTQITAAVTVNVLQRATHRGGLAGDTRVVSPVMTVLCQPAATQRPLRNCHGLWPHLFD
jgi:hypothetical protein